MSILKFNTATNKFTHGKVDIGDCNFTLPNPTLPITLATAFVDGNYSDTAPYFSTYALGAAWVQSRIAAGKATAGNIIITSNQTTCNLISNVNIWLAPSVTVDSIVGSINSNINIDGFGIIPVLSLGTCSDINIRARSIGKIILTSVTTAKIEGGGFTTTTISKSNGIDLIVKGSGGAISITGESRVNIEGLNGYFSSLTNDLNSSLRLKGCRVLGLTTNGSSFFDAQDCEFYATTGNAIYSVGEMSLTNCWVHSGNDNGIMINDGLSEPQTTVLNNVIIQAFGTYSVYDGSSSSSSASVYVYGNSCANKAMYHCTAMVNSLVVNSALRYKVY